MRTEQGHRRQFSLLWMLLLMVTVAIGAAWGVALKKNLELRAANQKLVEEIRQFREEAGQLTIDDGTQIHGLEIQEASPFCWKWRIYVPDGWPQTRHYLHVAVEFPADRLPIQSDQKLQFPRQAETVLSLRVLPNQAGERYLYAMVGDADGVKHPLRWLNVEQQPWVSQGVELLRQPPLRVSDGQFMAPPDQRVELLRLHTQGKELPDGEARGLLVWISNDSQG